MYIWQFFFFISSIESSLSTDLNGNKYSLNHFLFTKFLRSKHVKISLLVGSKPRKVVGLVEQWCQKQWVLMIKCLHKKTNRTGNLLKKITAKSSGLNPKMWNKMKDANYLSCSSSKQLFPGVWHLRKWNAVAKWLAALQGWNFFEVSKILSSCSLVSK